MNDERAGVAVEGLQDAADDLRGTVVRDITWFQPPEAKHLDPVSVATGFALVLATSFLAGFEQEARKTMKQLGRQSFRWLRGFVESYFGKTSGKADKQKPSSDEEEVKQLAKKAADTAASLDPEIYEKVLSATEERLGEELQATTAMPKKRAQELSRKIRTAAEKHVLAKRKRRK